MRIALSGSTGFIGTSLVPYLLKRGHTITPITRASFSKDLNSNLAGHEAVVHLAGLAHSKRSRPEDFEEINFALTLSLANAAREADVLRFIFISTINVVAGNHGVLKPLDPICPLNAYGASKAKAEQALLDMPDLEVSILRPPLVYGPRPKGNMAALTRLCLTGVPLPFGSVNNQRSLASITNVLSAIDFLCTANRSRVSGRIFHVSDDRDLSLREIVRTIRVAAGLPPRLLPVPVGLMRKAIILFNKQNLAKQLFDDLQVEASDLIAAGWSPHGNPAKDLIAMARSYL
jgi:UDP-glucose 4-epimerase